MATSPARLAPCPRIAKWQRSEPLDLLGKLVDQIDDFAYRIIVEFARTRAVLQHAGEIADRTEHLGRSIGPAMLAVAGQAFEERIDLISPLFQFGTSRIGGLEGLAGLVPRDGRDRTLVLDLVVRVDSSRFVVDDVVSTF